MVAAQKNICDERRRPKNEAGTDSASAAELEKFDYLLVPVGVFVAQVAQEAAAAPNKLEQTTTGVVIVFVNLEMLGEMLDARGEQTDLDAGGTGVVVVLAEFIDCFRVGGSGQVSFP